MIWTMDTNGTVAVSSSFGESGGCNYVKTLSLTLVKIILEIKGRKKLWEDFLSIRETILCGACDCFMLPSNLQIHLRSRGIKHAVCFAFLDRLPTIRTLRFRFGMLTIKVSFVYTVSYVYRAKNTFNLYTLV